MSSSYRSLELRKQPGVLETIFWSGLAVGVLDGLAGIIVYYFWFGFTPLKVFQFVASALYGKSAYTGGVRTFVIGFFMHFLIGYVCAIIYFFAYPKIRVLHTHKVWSGLLYGLLVYLFMNVVIMPMSKVVEGSFDVKLAVLRIIWHMFCVGLPVSLIIDRHYSARR